jgi:hypothetical protein
LIQKETAGGRTFHPRENEIFLKGKSRLAQSERVSGDQKINIRNQANLGNGEEMGIAIVWFFRKIHIVTFAL